MWKNLFKKKLKEYFKVSSSFIGFVKPQKKKLLTAMLSGVGYTVMGVLEPWPLKIIFDVIFYQSPLPKTLSFLSSLDPLWLLYSLVLSIVVIALMRGMFYYYQQLLTARAGQQITSSIRVKLFSHLQELSLTFHDKRKTGDLLSRLTSDIKMLRDILVSLPCKIATDLMMMTAMILVMSFMDLYLTALGLAVLPLLIILMKKYRKPMKEAMKEQREKEGTLATIASEVLGAIRVVQGFGRQREETAKFSSQSNDTLKKGLKTSRLEAKLKWASELSIALITSLILLTAGRQVIQGNMTPGDLLVFTFYLRMFNRPLKQFSKYMEQIARGTASGERLFELLETDVKIHDFPNSRPAPRFKGAISFDQVSLIYKGTRAALDSVSFEIEPGEKVALVGHTGSGKSTVASLIPRFWDPTSGQVLIDGHDIRNFTLTSLRDQIAIVFQEPILFATTIAENIAYGKSGATPDEIQEAAKQAGIHEIISNLEEGYQTVIGERGCTLSGGQRQCITIARALIKNCPIVILDEPTSGLDKESAKMVMEALNKLMKEKTCLVITHQPDLLTGIDKILHLKKGKLWTKSSKELAVH